MTNKIKISFVLPELLQKDYKSCMVENGYHLKGKSRWVSEAVGMLLNFENHIDLIKLNDEMTGFDKLESIIINRDLKHLINETAITVRKKYPAIEGVQSRIMRSAIMQRLLREQKFSD